MARPTTVASASEVVQAAAHRQTAKAVDCDDLGHALRLLAEHHFATRRGVSMKGVRGAPDWMGYETSLWQLSEQVRAFLKHRPDVRGEHPLLDVVAALAEEKRLGKGRQNLVLLLGDYGGGRFGDVLGRLLTDSDVYGHALKALHRARIGGFVLAAREIAARERVAWIRTAANKYCDRFGS